MKKTKQLWIITTVRPSGHLGRDLRIALHLCSVIVIPLLLCQTICLWDPRKSDLYPLSVVVEVSLVFLKCLFCVVPYICAVAVLVSPI